MGGKRPGADRTGGLRVCRKGMEEVMMTGIDSDVMMDGNTPQPVILGVDAMGHGVVLVWVMMLMLMWWWWLGVVPGLKYCCAETGRVGRRRLLLSEQKGRRKRLIRRRKCKS
jgi:hypothetical protein